MAVRLIASWFALPLLGALALPAQAAATETASPTAVTCASKAGDRQHCPADTSAGVALVRTTGSGVCLLGKTWGYDDAGVWVSDGCAGEFVLGSPGAGAEPAAGSPAAAPATGTAEPEAGTPKPAAPKPKKQPSPRIESWGEFEPGDGFLVGRNSGGELSISAYALVRYINQMGEDTYTDHFGNDHPVDGRQDIYPHRIMIFFKGWVGTPKLVYNLFVWTVNTTDQDALLGSLGYQFNRKFSLYGGVNGLPGTRSLQGSHPYWLGNDRVMADEFFRPYFGYGVWAQGEITPGLWYNTMIGNNSSALGIKAAELDRQMSYGTSFFWMPSTHEFGPKGAYGDWEHHDKVATRFGISMTFSPEQRFTDDVTEPTGNTTIKMADGLNAFETGALAPGVTVETVDYRLLAIDAGLKYKGLFLQAELYRRQLDDFQADGVLPVGEVVDTGFYVQAAFYPIPKKLELYAATSQIYGDKDAGYGDSSEYLAGMNWYVTKSRNNRLNLQIMDVNHSPAGSTFGYYVTGQDGLTVTTAFSIFF